MITIDDITEDYPTQCAEEACDYKISPMDDDSRFATGIGWVCWPCWESAEINRSVAHHVVDGEDTLYTIHEYGVFDAEGDEVEPPPLTRTYKRTDGWRGYYETTPVGEWDEVKTGWTTGNWGDPVADAKQAFNDWAQAVLEGEIVLDHPIWIIFDQTSNVFSTAVGVFVPKGVSLETPSL